MKNIKTTLLSLGLLGSVAYLALGYKWECWHCKEVFYDCHANKYYDREQCPNCGCGSLRCVDDNGYNTQDEAELDAEEAKVEAELERQRRKLEMLKADKVTNRKEHQKNLDGIHEVLKHVHNAKDLDYIQSAVDKKKEELGLACGNSSCDCGSFSGSGCSWRDCRW